MPLFRGITTWWRVYSSFYSELFFFFLKSREELKSSKPPSCTPFPQISAEWHNRDGLGSPSAQAGQPLWRRNERPAVQPPWAAVPCEPVTTGRACCREPGPLWESKSWLTELGPNLLSQSFTELLTLVDSGRGMTLNLSRCGRMLCYL